MVEIILIVLSVKISGRFKQAGQEGAKKYILGIWMTYLGAFVLAVAFGSMAAAGGNDEAMLATIYILLIVGYIIEIIVACKGMSHGKRLLQSMPMQYYGAGPQFQQGWGQQPPVGASFCVNCGNPLPQGVMFCSRCGSPVAATHSN